MARSNRTTRQLNIVVDDIATLNAWKDKAAQSGMTIKEWATCSLNAAPVLAKTTTIAPKDP